MLPGIEKPIDILDPEKEQIKLKAIREEKIIQGHWWKVNHEFEPFSKISDLALVLGDGNKETGLSRMYKNASKSIKQAADKIFLVFNFLIEGTNKNGYFFPLLKRKRVVM